MVVAALTAAWSGAAHDATAAGKTLVVGLVAEPTSMDPGQLTDINSMRVLSSVYDTLVRFKEGSFTQEPGLATAWKMSPDGLTYTFTLRKSVKFHDGTAFDAEAVKFTYDRLLDPKHPYAETGPFPFAVVLLRRDQGGDRRRSGHRALHAEAAVLTAAQQPHAQHRPHRQPRRGQEVR